MKKTTEKYNKKKDYELIRDINDDTDQFKKFIYILCGVALVAVILYFVSNNYLIKDSDLNDNKNNTTSATISYTEVNVGNVFNRPYDEYYVFAYNPEDKEASYYASLLNNFKSEKGKLYYLNLSIDVNSKYVKDSSNKNATQASELSFNGPTLIKIKKGKIDKYLEKIDDIEKELK